jgi:hypothetical protein
MTAVIYRYFAACAAGSRKESTLITIVIISAFATASAMDNRYDFFSIAAVA